MKILFIKFLRDESGVSLVEFAFLLPVMLLLLIGTMEVSNLLRLDRKVTQAAHTAVDLVAQSSTLNDAELADILRAVELSVFPFAEGNLSLGISSVEFDADDASATLAWSESLQDGAVDNVLAKVNGLEAAGFSVIVASAQYDYQPIFGDFLFDSFEIEETAFSRPRNSLTVVRN